MAQEVHQVAGAIGRVHGKALVAGHGPHLTADHGDNSRTNLVASQRAKALAAEGGAAHGWLHQLTEVILEGTTHGWLNQLLVSAQQNHAI